MLGPLGLLDYGSATLRCKILSLPFLGLRPHALHPGAIQGKEGIKFCHLATLAAGVGAGAPEDRLLAPAGPALRDDPAVAAGDGGAARALPRDAAAAAPPARPAPSAAAVGAARPRAGVLGVAEHTRAADSEPGGGESAGSQMNTDGATTKKWS